MIVKLLWHDPQGPSVGAAAANRQNANQAQTYWRAACKEEKPAVLCVPLTLMIKSMDIYLITKHFYAASLKWYEWVVRNEVTMTTDFMHAFIYLDYIYIYTMFTIHDQLSKWQKSCMTLYIVAHFEHEV